jgi:beta-lactamase class A
MQRWLAGAGVVVALLGTDLVEARPRALPAASVDPIVHLETEMARLGAQVEGRVGAVAIHIETGRVARLNADETYPMASVSKFPIALLLMRQVDAGLLRLDQPVDLQRADIVPGSGFIGSTLPHPGLTLSLANLIEVMMTESDNSSTDKLLAIAGGPAAVTTYLQGLGVTSTRVDRSIRQLLADAAGIPEPPMGSAFTRSVYRDRVGALTTAEREAARSRFDTDPRDTADPDEIALLLARLARGELLSPASTTFLLEVMDRTRTGRGRIRGVLPEGTPVANKTGTLAGTTNDIGIITLPDGAGRVAIAAFVKQSPVPSREREPAIAQISRAAHDFFLFNRGPGLPRASASLPAAPLMYQGGGSEWSPAP